MRRTTPGVIVPDDQLSLAIGKEGQNARLAARLTGWHIDIKNETLAADILKNVPVPAAPAEDLIYEDDEDLEPERCICGRGRRALPQPVPPRFALLRRSRRTCNGVSPAPMVIDDADDLI